MLFLSIQPTNITTKVGNLQLKNKQKVLHKIFTVILPTSCLVKTNYGIKSYKLEVLDPVKTILSQST